MRQAIGSTALARNRELLHTARIDAAYGMYPSVRNALVYVRRHFDEKSGALGRFVSAVLSVGDYGSFTDE